MSKQMRKLATGGLGTGGWEVGATAERLALRDARTGALCSLAVADLPLFAAGAFQPMGTGGLWRGDGPWGEFALTVTPADGVLTLAYRDHLATAATRRLRLAGDPATGPGPDHHADCRGRLRLALPDGAALTARVITDAPIAALVRNGYVAGFDYATVRDFVAAVELRLETRG